MSLRIENMALDNAPFNSASPVLTAAVNKAA
jgi:hypothetical protein